MTSTAELNLMRRLGNFDSDRVLDALREYGPLTQAGMLARGAGSRQKLPTALQLLAMRRQIETKTLHLGPTGSVVEKMYFLAGESA